MQPPSRRSILRQRSAGIHAELDQMVGSFDSIDAYRRYVGATAHFRIAAESDLPGQEWPGEFGGWRPTIVGDALRRDLLDLGLPLPESGRLHLPTDTYDALLGVCYVLEGSGLGAKLLHKRALNLGLTGSFGARHLAVQAAADQNWRAFTGLLETVHPLDMTKTSDAALATFQAAGQALAIVQ